MSNGTASNGILGNGRGPVRPERRTSLLRWLRPGIGIKRWLLLVFLGQLLLVLAVGLAVRQVVGLANLVELLGLGLVPPEFRPLTLLLIGLGVFLAGAFGLFRAVVEPLRVRDEPLADLLYERRSRARGPRVVAIGGGTGLSSLLRGLKELTSNITAVVTVADDGGSSGKLRQELGVPPMGDIRNCIAALADAEPAMNQLLQYRFPSTGERSNGIEGHAFGNLLIAALADIEGDFEEAVRQSNRVLAVRGKVVPAAPVPIILHAELEDGVLLEGQSRIARARGVQRVWLTPPEARAGPEALEAIAAADLVLIGPGSLYTSILPSLLVPGISEALERTSAARLFICNVATQVGETEAYGLAAHLAALSNHGLDTLIDAVLANNNFKARTPGDYPAEPVRVDVPLRGRQAPPIILRDVVDNDNAHHHDPHKLAATILALHEERVVRRAPATQRV